MYEYEIDDFRPYRSTEANRLKRKYQIKHFLELTEKGKEALWALCTFTVSILALSFFYAHFMLFMTGHYETVQAIVINH